MPDTPDRLAALPPDPARPPTREDLAHRPPGRGGNTPNLEELDRGFAAAANLLHRLLDHTHELDTADLPVVDGRVVRIVALAEVEEWLLGLETRVRNGTIL